jgi:hypothetical protein
MAGEGAVLLIIALAYAGAGLVDLVLLPFRPLMPKTYIVGTTVVRASRVDPGGQPLPIDHYLIQPPEGPDWYVIAPPDVPPEAPHAGAPLGPKPAAFPGARMLFVRKPTTRKFLAVRGLSRAFSVGPGGPPRGRTDPAAFVRIEQLEPDAGGLRAQLVASIERGRTRPDGGGLPDTADSRYRLARSEQSFADVGGIPCVRDEFVLLSMDEPGAGHTVTRYLAFTVMCADPACPGQAVSLNVRATGNDTDVAEREVRTFLEGARVDRALTPACAARQ